MNAYLLNPANLLTKGWTEHMPGSRQVRPITCVSGLTFSAQASVAHYCLPRNGTGPWEEVEVGFPSERVEEFMAYVDNPDDPTDTVYGWVPVEVVEAVVNNHGGIVEQCLSDSQ